MWQRTPNWVKEEALENLRKWLTSINISIILGGRHFEMEITCPQRVCSVPLNRTVKWLHINRYRNQNLDICGLPVHYPVCNVSSLSCIMLYLGPIECDASGSMGLFAVIALNISQGFIFWSDGLNRWRQCPCINHGQSPAQCPMTQQEAVSEVQT